MRKLKDPKTHKVVALELTAEEMAKTLEVELEDLENWTKVIPPHSMDKGRVLYRILSVKDVQKLKKYAALLRSQMSQDAVLAVEASNLLDAYAALAEDCPEGLTVQVWRSYGLIVLMQIRFGKMLDAKELAQRANLTEVDPETGDLVLSEKLATAHLRLLMSMNYLAIGGKNLDGQDIKEVAWEGQWKHKGLPKAFQPRQAS